MDSINENIVSNAMKSFPKEKVESAIKSALTALMAIEFICVVGIYLLLRTYVSFNYAEIWMIVMYAWTLKSMVDMYEKKSMKQLQKAYKNELEKTDEEDKECTGKDNTSN